MSGRAWQRKVRDTYADLVNQGLYTTSFRHAEADRRFVQGILGPILESCPPPASVLEVGCGAGEWLELVQSLPAADRPGFRLAGFDLTSEMVEVARQRLADRVPTARLYVADMLDPDAYATPELIADEYSLIYAFDVVQQLPVEARGRGVSLMFRRLAPGGRLVIFDQDAASPAGRKMRLRKAVTRYLGIPLVPRFYLIARYPAAAELVRRLEGLGASVRLERRGTHSRFAVIAERTA